MWVEMKTPEKQCLFNFWGRETHKDVKVFCLFSDWLAPWRWGRSQSPKCRKTFTSWQGCQPENISLKSITVEASRLITMFTFNQEVIFVAGLLKKWAEISGKRVSYWPRQNLCSCQE